MSDFEFGSLNLEDVASEDTRLNEGGQNNFLDQFIPMPDVKPGQSGSVTIRILPPTKGGKLFQYNRVHSVKDKKVHCPRPLVNGKWDRNVPCALCDYYNSLWRKADLLTKAGRLDEAEKLKDEARSIKPVERYYYNAIARSITVDGKVEKNVGPRILSVGKILHTMIVRAIMGDPADADSKLGNITDPKNGYDFIIRKEVTSGDGFPKYERSGFARNSSPLGTPEEIAQWAASLHDLTKLRNPPEAEVVEKMLAIHRGLIPDDDTTFNTDSFDAKWGGEAQAVTGPTREKFGPVTGTTGPSREQFGPLPVANPMDNPMEVAGPTREKFGPVTSPTSPTGPSRQTSGPLKAAEDVPIEDEDFLKELAGME